MRIQCDVCEKAPATVVCCADEAALCARCDVQVHAANKLASKHQRLHLDCLSQKLPLCDICREKPAFIFCVEDRALFCQDCDESIHVAGSLSGQHQRLLATGISVALSSNGSNTGNNKEKEHSKVKGFAQLQSKKPTIIASEAPVMQQVPTAVSPSAWSVEDFLQLSDYEPGDKRGAPVGFGELEWFADIGLFQDQESRESLAAAEVPEMPKAFATSTAAYYKPAKSMKKPRIEYFDEEDFFTVPDLG